MAASSQINETRFGELAEALRQEIQTGPTDATKSIRVRHGIYSLRGKAGQYIVRIRIPAGVLTTGQLETVAALTEQSGWEAGAHLTTRQGIEIAGLPAVEIPAALEQLEADRPDNVAHGRAVCAGRGGLSFFRRGAGRNFRCHAVRVGGGPLFSRTRRFSKTSPQDQNFV